MDRQTAIERATELARLERRTYVVWSIARCWWDGQRGYWIDPLDAGVPDWEAELEYITW